MDVIDNELDTSGNGVPNTSNNTQSVGFSRRRYIYGTMMFMTI